MSAFHKRTPEADMDPLLSISDHQPVLGREEVNRQAQELVNKRECLCQNTMTSRTCSLHGFQTSKPKTLQKIGDQVTELEFHLNPKTKSDPLKSYSLHKDLLNYYRLFPNLVSFSLTLPKGCSAELNTLITFQYLKTLTVSCKDIREEWVKKEGFGVLSHQIIDLTVTNLSKVNSKGLSLLSDFRRLARLKLHTRKKVHLPAIVFPGSLESLILEGAFNLSDGAFSNLVDLKTAKLESVTGLTDFALKSIASNENLRRLETSGAGNLFTDLGFIALSTLKLKHLKLSSVQCVNQDILTHFFKNQELKTLSLFHVGDSGGAQSLFWYQSTLKSLEIGRNESEREPKVLINALTTCVNLKSLTIVNSTTVFHDLIKHLSRVKRDEYLPQLDTLLLKSQPKGPQIESLSGVKKWRNRTIKARHAALTSQEKSVRFE